MSKHGIDSRSHSGDALVLGQATDLYGYLPSVSALTATLSSCATPFVAAVYGRWGRGKSTFIETLSKQLEGLENSVTQHRYSPWQYRLETFDDVWLSLITELSSGNGEFAESLKKSVAKANRWRMLRRVVSTAAEAAKAGAGSVVASVGAEDNDFQQFIETKRQFAESVASFRRSHLGGKVFIYIDDVDRCDPPISVGVLRAVQVLCRTVGCVFVLGMDRDVIVSNLRTVYSNDDFAREYLDKVVQLHVEVPTIPTERLVTTLQYRGDGTTREGIARYSEWMVVAMDHNPRKVERAAFLFDYKVAVSRALGHRDDAKVFADAARSSVIELLRPELAAAGAANADTLKSVNALLTASTEQERSRILASSNHLPAVARVHDDHALMHLLRRFPGAGV